MGEPQKPFACSAPDCGMTFTNEDHLHVHTKKHDMILQLGLEQKGAFVADQTPTPTRFIRNCEEVGLFQDLQNVNPFDEGFKRAMETKHSIMCLENGTALTSTDDLHTPQMVFPLDADSTLFSSTNNQRNITISRSSSDESGAIKEFETTTISKLTNEVTTISRIVEKHDDQTKNDKDSQMKKDSVSYTNNVIKIHSNVEIRKDNDSRNPIQTLIYEDTVIKDGNIVSKDLLHAENNKLNLPTPPIMSQKSIDFVVDSLTADLCSNKDNLRQKEVEKPDNYEVILKLPNGRQVRMKSVDDMSLQLDKKEANAKERIKQAIERKKSVTRTVPIVPNITPISATLIPVTIFNPIISKVPIAPCKLNRVSENKTKSGVCVQNNSEKTSVVNNNVKSSNGVSSQKQIAKDMLESRSAASRRYRARLKETWTLQAKENRELKEINERLKAEKAALKALITEHMKHCPNADELRATTKKLKLI